jgi:hypothetical protein
MFKKILIANCGDQARSAAATESHRLAGAARSGDLTAETRHV